MCDCCRNNLIWKKFDTPRDYLACIEYISQLVADGGFEFLTDESTCPLNQVKTDDGWADEIMVHTIRCRRCGQIFTCMVTLIAAVVHSKKAKVESSICFQSSIENAGGPQ